jgi:hypothetical protein
MIGMCLFQILIITREAIFYICFIFIILVFSFNKYDKYLKLKEKARVLSFNIPISKMPPTVISEY